MIAHSSDTLDFANDPVRTMIDHLAQGSEAAFEALYLRYRAFVLGVASRILRSTSEAEEVAQEVFFELWTHPPEARCGARSLSAWLNITTKTRCWLILRRSRRRALVEPLSGDFSYWDSSFDTILASRLREQLEAEFPRVAADHRSILWLTYYKGMGPTEIAAHLGLPVITVRRRLRAVIGRLRLTFAAHSSTLCRIPPKRPGDGVTVIRS